MQVLESEKQVPVFLNYIATKKKNFGDWAFLHIIISKDQKDLQIDEVAQTLSFQFSDDQTMLLKLQHKKELILVTHNDNNRALSLIDKTIYENFSSDVLRTTINIFQESSLVQFGKIISSYISSDSIGSQLLLKRCLRTSNNMIVMDDDEMVLRQFEKLLLGFGNVISVQNPEDFFDRYVEYAPDIVFLDIHLPNARGPDLLKTLLNEYDPYAYVIMISSDTKQNTILEVKEKGAKGFVVKPFARDKLYQHILRIPTFNPKKT